MKKSAKKTVYIVAEKSNNEFYHTVSLNNGLEKKVFSIDHSTMPPVNEGCDVLILDCGFQVKKGLRLLREIKAKNQSVPVIFLTDTGTEETAVEAFRAGARDYFKKPVNLFEIQDTIARLVNMVKTSSGSRTQLVNRRIQPGRRTIVQFDSDVPNNILRSISFIEEQLPDTKTISLERLAEKANLSRYHFCRAFKKTTGMTPMKFVNSLKVNRAKELLRRRDKNISRIAIESGFQDLSNFNRQFRKITGLTPSSYKGSITK